MNARRSRADTRGHAKSGRGLLPAGLLSLLPLAASPQALNPDQLHEIDDDATDVTYEDLTVDDLEDMDIVRDGEVIGEVEEVLGNDDGEIVALVVEYGGNLVGLGEKEVVVPIEELEFPGGQDHIETTMSDEQLAALDPWDD